MQVKTANKTLQFQLVCSGIEGQQTAYGDMFGGVDTYNCVVVAGANENDSRVGARRKLLRVCLKWAQTNHLQCRCNNLNVKETL